MVFRYSEAENPTNYYRFEAYIEVEMTKISSATSMPERIPSKMNHTKLITDQVDTRLYEFPKMKLLEVTR
jgi:hypothetical protein